MKQTIPLITIFRMWRDYLQYVAYLQKGETIELVAELSLFGLSLYLLTQELFSHADNTVQSNTVSIVAILVIIKFFWEMYKTYKQIRRYFNIQHSILRNPSNITKLFPSQKEQSEGFIALDTPTTKPDRVFVSDRITRHIQTTPLTISLTQKKNKHIHEYLEKHKEVLLQYLNYYFFSSLKNNREFTNSQKLCISADITTHTHTVICHTGGYYDSFLTNNIIGTTLVLKDKKNTTINTEHIFPSHTDEQSNVLLSDLSSSPMSNHIGCSTIGFTEDHHFIIWTQGTTNQSSNGLLVPTGSGSCNDTDILDNNLQKTVMYCMERELIEESTPDATLSRNYQTMLLGFFRWGSRGGKPEFVGVTKLPGTVHMYKPNTQEVHIKKAFSMPTIDSLPDVIKEIQHAGPLSVPLFMCLRQLEYMYQNYRNELQNFLFGNQ